MTRRKTRTMAEHLRRDPLAEHFLDVLLKHHPEAGPDEIAIAMGGHTTFLGEVEFDEYEPSEEDYQRLERQHEPPMPPTDEGWWDSVLNDKDT